MQPRNARVGIFLFFIYLALYGGFVLLAAFSPKTLAALPLAGVNLAIWYGFGLIAAALVLALIYGWICRHEVLSPSESGHPDPSDHLRSHNDSSPRSPGDRT